MRPPATLRPALLLAWALLLVAPPSARADDAGNDRSAVIDERVQQADRLVTAGNIKTQILRVEKQLAQLSEQAPRPDAPALDAGDETAPDDPQPAENDDEDGQDNEEDPATDQSDTFFGIPLE